MLKRITLPLASAFAALLLLTFSAPVPAQDNQTQDAIIEEIEIRGSRRIPKESIFYYIQSKVNERYSEAQARRDLEAILNLGFFDPLKSRVSTVDGPRGGKILIFTVSEYPIIRDLQYRNLKSATESEILTRFKERRVGVSKESQFDPSKANAARVAIRDLLAEKGHPDAEVNIEIEDISATAVALIFNVTEGPRVRVKEINFTGLGDKFSQRRLRGAMKLVKEAGLISTFTSKDVYFRDKLLADLERVRLYLGSQGYLQAKIGEPQVVREGTVSSGIPLIPILQKKGPGLKITVPIEVGRKYTITKIDEKGVTLFQPGVVTAVTGLKVGDVASAEKIQKGVYENIKNIYGDRGYIEASADLEPNFIDSKPETGEVEFTIQVDEGKQFTMRRLEFIGNTNTRDVVLRREVLLNEGDPYSKRYWDLSILRLNQLGLFEEVKEKDAITRTNPRDQTVDIDLQVKERGRQQIQLNGGVSGFQGSFFGISYSTNNLLGYGETLSIDLQGGNRQQLFSVGFSEPYLLGKPISLGVSLFAQKYQFIGSGFNFNQAQLLQASFFGLSSFDANTLFTQQTAGGTVNISSPLQVFTNRFERYSRFTRVGASYSLTGTSVQDPEVNRDADPKNDIPVTFSQPRIITSRFAPYLSFNTLNSSLDPTRGQSVTATFSLAGGPLGGDVSVFSPSLEYKFFMPAFRRRSERPHVFGMRFLGAHARAFGTPIDTGSLSFVGGVPIFERFFLGGEFDLRGYNIRSISPVVQVDSFLSTRGPIVPKVLDANGNLVDAPAGSVAPSVLRSFQFDAPENRGGAQCSGLTAPDPSRGCNTVQATRFFTPVGGDTQLLANFEYRVPVFSDKLSAVAFADVGTVFNARKYNDQVLTLQDDNGNPRFVPGQTLTPSGVVVNPAGRVATQAEIQSAQIPGQTPAGVLPPGFRTVFLTGDSRNFDIVRLSQEPVKFLSDLRSSMGLEFRVQVPVINVPFRLIFFYNPNVKTDVTDPRVLFLERRTGVRFSVGRTF
jgi:outer membrane protein insertion porin family